MRLVTISGESGCGKSTVEAMMEKLGFIRLISYTTRIPREGEVNNKDYHFVTKDKFDSLFNKGYIIEKAQYCNNWYGLEQPVGGTDYVAVVEKDGVESLKKLYGKQVFSVYLDIDTDEAIRRRNNRNNSALSLEENNLRNKEDAEKFEHMREVADVVININGKDASQVVKEILERIRDLR